MNKRTGWTRRWSPSPNPSLEILEDRLVLSPGSQAWQPLVAKIAQYGKLADSLPAITPPLNTSTDGSTSFMPAATNLMEHISAGIAASGNTREDVQYLTDSPGKQAHTVLDIERVIINYSPAPANLNITDVQSAASYALNLFAGTAPATSAVSHPAPVAEHDFIPRSVPVPIHEIGSSQPDNTAEPVPAHEATKTTPPAKDPTAPAEVAAPTERATAAQATADPNADVAARIAADAEAWREAVVNPQAPTGEDAARPRPISAPPQDAGASFLLANGIGQAMLFRTDNYYTPDTTPPEFVTVSSPFEASGPMLEEKLLNKGSVAINVPDPPAPQAADLILEFVPFNMADFHAAVETFLTELEQLCFGSGGRGWIGMGLLLGSLVATGLTGQTAWERMRRRGRYGRLEEEAGGSGLAFLPFLGMPEPEAP
jgi:hypothetical protein